MSFVYYLIAKLLAIRPVRNRIIARAKRTPYSHIMGLDGSVYMERYWLFNPYGAFSAEERMRRSWLRRHLPSVRLHIIRRPDRDRHMHDHPWNARTFILAGSYMERRQSYAGDNLGGRFLFRRSGDTARLNFGEYHKITNVSSTGCVTLFVTFKYRGPWGFLVGGQKVPWREYLRTAQVES